MAKRICLVASLLFLVSPSGFSQSVEFKEFKLKNGLRVILSEDHSAPTYSIAVTYNVGSRDEKKGRTGFAHLFEHMMFQGSEKVGKGEHLAIINNNGGEVNGNTTADRTMYFETLPANQIDLALFLESDRMRSLVINRANLDNQRATVQEERRQRYDNAPYGKTYEALLDTFYDNFAYKHSTIGSMEDLNAATVEDVSAFFKTYYAPNNAVLTMVGDFNTDEVLRKIRTYFEDIPQQAPPPAPDVTEPKQTAERRKVVEDPLAQLTQLDIVFKIPPGNTPDWYALDVAGVILANGQSSRLYEKLVREKQLLQSISAGSMEFRGPSMFQISATLRPGVDPAEVEKLIYEELDRMKTEPVTDVDLEKVRMLVKRISIQQMESTQGRARTLGESAVFYNDPNLVNTFQSKYGAVNKQQIQRAAQTYWIQTNRTVVTTVPKPQPTEGKEN